MEKLAVPTYEQGEWESYPHWIAQAASVFVYSVYNWRGRSPGFMQKQKHKLMDIIAVRCPFLLEGNEYHGLLIGEFAAAKTLLDKYASWPSGCTEHERQIGFEAAMREILTSSLVANKQSAGREP